MKENINKIKSPINKEIQLKEVLNCKDFTVSNEVFSLLKDEKSELLITSPQPKLENLSKYYESEDYISHTDSSKSLFDKIYQLVKKYAIGKKVKMVNEIEKRKKKKERREIGEDVFKNRSTKNQKPKTILDIGCGTGDFLAACKKEKWNVVGVEPNTKAAAFANSKLQNIYTGENSKNSEVNLKLFNDINELEKENKFDVITMWHVLEHIPNLEKYISQLKQLLKPNGRLVIAVPNYKSFDAKYYKEFWAAYDVPRHLWHFSQKAIKDLFEKESIIVEKTIPMKLDSFYVSLLSEKYKNGKSNPVKAFHVGLLSNIKAKRTKEYSSLIYILKNI